MKGWSGVDDFDEIKMLNEFEIHEHVKIVAGRNYEKLFGWIFVDVWMRICMYVMILVIRKSLRIFGGENHKGRK